MMKNKGKLGGICMKKIIFMSMFALLILTACGGEDLSEGDTKACESYQETVQQANDGEISDEEMLAQLEEAFFMAESDRLQDLLDDLLIYFEEGEGELQDTVNSIRVWCNLE